MRQYVVVELLLVSKRLSNPQNIGNIAWQRMDEGLWAAMVWNDGAFEPESVDRIEYSLDSHRFVHSVRFVDVVGSDHPICVLEVVHPLHGLVIQNRLRPIWNQRAGAMTSGGNGLGI